MNSTEAARTCSTVLMTTRSSPSRPAGLADVDLGHDIGAAAGSKLGSLVDSDRAEHVGPGALHELQIIGVIDDPVGVGVLEIDREREVVLGPDEAAAIGWSRSSLI